jgi:hypothetical protein
MNRHLTELCMSHGTALWAAGILATACTVPLSRPLRRAPRCRSAVIGLGVMLFSAPVYALSFDPWWARPWPSLYHTVAIATGEFKHVSAFFHREFWLPPFAWGILAAFVAHVFCPDVFARRPTHGPPFA